MSERKKELWELVKPKMIPDITPEQVEEMAALIKPVMVVDEKGEAVSSRDGFGRWREIDIEGVNRTNVAFTWSPKPGRPVRIYRGGLNEVNIITFHTWAYYGFFKPTLAEVYACIRAFVPEWEHVRFFWMDNEGMDGNNIVGDYHWCRCVLFGEEEYDVVDAWWDAFTKACGHEAKPMEVSG